MNFKEFQQKIEESTLQDTELPLTLETINDLLDGYVYINFAKVLSEASENVIKTAVSKISDVRDTLEDYVIYIDSKKYMVSWDSEILSVKDEEGEELFKEEAGSIEEVKEKLINFFSSLNAEKSFSEFDPSLSGEAEEEQELVLDTMIDTETDSAKKNKLIHLKNYIIPEFINVFVTNKEQRDALIQAILKHINDERVPVSLKSGVKSSIIKLFFNILDIIIDDRGLANTFTTNTSSSVIYEARKKKKGSIVDKVSKKLEYLLRLGLADKRFIHRIKKALTMNKVSAASIKLYRDIIFDLISEIIDYIENDSVIYNKMRILLSKKGSLIKNMNETYNIITETCNSKKKFAPKFESAPPNFPEKLEKKLLKYYKDNEELAYATMWKIHNLRKKKKEKKNG